MLMSRAASLVPQSLTPRQVAAALAAAGLLTAVTACGVRPAASQVKPAAPAFTNMAAATFTVGQPAGFTVSTSVPKAAVTEIGSVPAGLTFKATRSGAMLSGRPASGTGGVHDITLAARDHGGRASQLLTLTILQVPQFASHPSISATRACSPARRSRSRPTRR
jgi:putative Ig domain-containing protein